MKSKIISIVLCLGVILALTLVPAAQQAQQALAASPEWGYEIQPNVTKVGFNTDFNVTVSAVCYAGNADTWNIMVDFDPTYLQVIGITMPATLPNPPNNSAPDGYPGEPTLNNTAGWVFDGYGTPYGTATVNVTFAAWTIHFRSNNVTTGGTYLNLVTVNAYYSTMAILAGNDCLNWTRVVNGTVMIGTPQLTVNVTPAKGDVKINGVTPSSYPNTTTRSWDALVSLEAVNNSTSGWGFDHWSGDLTESTTPTSITMNAIAKNVTANFVEQPPKISPVPLNLTFNGSVGGNVTNRTLDIYNGGGYTLNWTANITGPNATLFNMSPKSGGNLAAAQCNATQVAVNTTGLAVGIYHANITISEAAPGGDTAYNAVGGVLVTPVTVPVTLNLGVPAILASPKPLTFATNEGENPADKTLVVCNSGNGTLNWMLTDNAAWLNETPTSGSLNTTECKNVTVSVDSSGLAAGDHSATITITDLLASNNPQTVSVSLHIAAAAAGAPVGPGTPGWIAPVEPASLSCSGLSISPQQVKPGQEVTISINVKNTGGERGSYNAILYINSVVEDSQSVSVDPGMTKNVIFKVSKSDAGVYDVLICGQSGQFEVVHTGWFGGGLGTGGIVVIVVIVIVLILALVFVLRGTRREV